MLTIFWIRFLKQFPASIRKVRGVCHEQYMMPHLMKLRNLRFAAKWEKNAYRLHMVVSQASVLPCPVLRALPSYSSIEQESVSVNWSLHRCVTQSLEDSRHCPSVSVDFQCIPGSCKKTSFSKKALLEPARKIDKTLACLDLSR